MTSKSYMSPSQTPDSRSRIEDLPTWQPSTRLIHGGTLRSEFCETGEAVFLNSGYVYATAEEAEAAFDGTTERYVYSRFRNPTVQMFEDRLALLEGAPACRATASGMAAVFAALACQLEAGDRVVASRALFGSCAHIVTQILPRYGVTATIVEGTDLDAWTAALATPAKVVFLETPSNPGLEVIDLPAVCALAHAAGARVVVDNVFATPILQSPLTLGADVVVYSATKHIDGQGRCLGGAVLGDRAFIEDELGLFLRHTGPSLSPFNAWVLLKGLETLELRVERHCATALAVARYLEGRGDVPTVRYPGLESHPQHALAARQMKAGGPIVAFDVGSKERAFGLMNALRLVTISNNLGDAKSLICHPATTTHQKLSPEEKTAQGITPGFLRLSVGLEAAEDLVADLGRALDSMA